MQYFSPCTKHGKNEYRSLLSKNYDLSRYSIQYEFVGRHLLPIVSSDFSDLTHRTTLDVHFNNTNARAHVCVCTSNIMSKYVLSS